MGVSITAYKEALQTQKGRKSILTEQLNGYNESLLLLKKRQEAIVFAQTLIQQVAKETQELIVVHIEDIVNKCIDTVFPDQYLFKLEFRISRGKSEAQLKFYKGTNEVDILRSDAGGVVDIATLGLRIAAWSLSNSANVMLFDESLKFVSRNLQERASEVLQELSKALKLQFLFVSHSDELIVSADVVHRVAIDKKGVSHVTY